MTLVYAMDSIGYTIQDTDGYRIQAGHWGQSFTETKVELLNSDLVDERLLLYGWNYRTVLN